MLNYLRLNFLIFILTVNLIQGQTNVKYLQRIDVDTLSENTIVLPMSFAESFWATSALPAIENKLIRKIVLVYTKEKLSEHFNQQLLNKNRWKQLLADYPQLKTNNLWQQEEWQQTESERTAAKQLFHGFIIYFTPPFSESQRQAELQWVARQLHINLPNNQLNESPSGSNFPVKNNSAPDNPAMFTKDTVRSFTLKQRWDDRIGFVHDTIWTEEEKVVKITKTIPDYKPKPDSTVISALLQLDSTQKYVVVMDATGSMGSYIVDALDWIFANRNRLSIDGFVFFNDGDRKKSKNKRPMHTGGIYACGNDSLKIKETLMKCMYNGNGGGEQRENDVEAIVYAQKKFPRTNQIILIADNKEWMRDYFYYPKINKPVNVILCDTKTYPLNSQYLNLVASTQGILFISNKTFVDLWKWHEGDYLIHKDIVYRKYKGEFNREYK